MSNSILTSVLGMLFVLAGLIVPSSSLVGRIRTTPADFLEQLILGAILFKIGLVILGVWIIVLGRVSIWRPQIQGEKSPSHSCEKQTLAILAGVLVAALALRLYRLDCGLWYDEIVTYVKYVKMPFGEIVTTYDSQNQHFLYALLARACVLTFGESAWSLRLPAVVIGVGSIWALYLLGREASSVREGLLSAALLTFSYHHIWFSQNARGYTGLLFWTILASWLFLRALHEERPQVWLPYAIASALGMYTHVTMLFVISGHFIIYLITLIARRNEVWPYKWAGLFLGFCLAAFLAFQLYAIVFPQLLSSIAGPESEGRTVKAWTNPLWTLLQFAEGMQISFTGSVVAIAVLLVFGAGLLNLTREKAVVVQLLTIPVFVGAAITMGLGHHLWPRFFFFSFGFGVIVIVRGTMVVGRMVAQLLHLDSTESVRVGTALAAAVIFVSSLSIPLAYGPKQDYDAAFAFVEENKEPGDAVVTVGLATIPYELYYEVDWEKADTLDDLNDIRSRAQRTWLLYTLPLQLESLYPEIVKSIQHDFEVVKQFDGTLGGGAIFVCRSDMASSESPEASVEGIISDW